MSTPPATKFLNATAREPVARLLALISPARRLSIEISSSPILRFHSSRIASSKALIVVAANRLNDSRLPASEPPASKSAGTPTTELISPDN